MKHGKVWFLGMVEIKYLFFICLRVNHWVILWQCGKRERWAKKICVKRKIPTGDFKRDLFGKL